MLAMAMLRSLLSLSLAVAALAVGGATASAHMGGGALIIVTADHILPGQAFEVVAADMGSDAIVRFEISQDDLVVPLESATAGPDGHFQATLTLPASFPTGYAELFAIADDGSQASTWVLVGERTESTPGPPSQPNWWADPSVLVLALLLVGAVGALAILLLRPKQPAKPVGKPSITRKKPRGARSPS
jgi:hypothetical protein